MPETEVSQWRHEEIDINIAAGYVTWIVDIWHGERDDPAVGIDRYIGVWNGEQLEKEDGEAFDPSFDMSKSSYRRRPTPEPLVWERIETIRSADREYIEAKNEYERLTSTDRYSYGMGRQKELYIAFMDAIDVLAEDDTNEEAWEKVHAYRNYNAMKHEKV